MKLETFRQAVHFLDRSSIDEVRLLGGEPTLHPEFDRIISLSLNSQKKIKLFSNGLMSKEAIEILKKVPQEKLSVMINVTPDDINNKEQILQQKTTIKELMPRVMLSYNIYRADMSFDPLLAFLKLKGIEKTIRLGLALPVLEGDNQWLHPQYYSFVGEKIIKFVQKTSLEGINLSFDCGFVPCMFSQEGIDILRKTGADMKWRCSPILDVDTRGRIYFCFPLADMFQVALDDKMAADNFRASFTFDTGLFRKAGIYKDCDSCIFKHSGECPGGCLAVTIRRFHSFK